jgi:hypothetical protein
MSPATHFRERAGHLRVARGKDYPPTSSSAVGVCPQRTVVAASPVGLAGPVPVPVPDDP